VLPNQKIINPRGIRTGGVPPYLQTREYVARGKIVYQNISGERFFPARVRATVEGSVHEDPESKPTLEATPGEGSIYSSESGEKQPTQQTVRSTKSKGTAQTTSIYVN
jgi:hypothetical protein